MAYETCICFRYRSQSSRNFIRYLGSPSIFSQFSILVEDFLALSMINSGCSQIFTNTNFGVSHSWRSLISCLLVLYSLTEWCIVYV